MLRLMSDTCHQIDRQCFEQEKRRRRDWLVGQQTSTDSNTLSSSRAEYELLFCDAALASSCASLCSLTRCSHSAVCQTTPLHHSTVVTLQSGASSRKLRPSQQPKRRALGTEGCTSLLLDTGPTIMTTSSIVMHVFFDMICDHGTSI